MYELTNVVFLGKMMRE